MVPLSSERGSAGGSSGGAAGSAERCSERIRGLYGEELIERPSVLHPTAVWNDGTGRLFTLRIGPSAPASETDRFVLQLARARVDAIVTTGRILREEPGLRHDLEDPDLTAWRAERTGGTGPPVSVVLTGRADLDLAHPLFGPRPAIVVTSEAAAPELRARAAASVEIVGRPRTDLRETLRWLREDRSFASVSVEAGPSTSLDLYRHPLQVDELMLSVFDSPSLAAGARGGAFLDAADIDRLFPVGSARRSECSRDEESGRWSFCRFSSRS